MNLKKGPQCLLPTPIKFDSTKHVDNVNVCAELTVNSSYTSD
jgi:hypothetical protein